MLVPKEEMIFDFKGATFDLDSSEDRELLGWIFNQFLYGEVTGIQCGYWLYRAPHLNAASFLARQAQEELSHVRRFLRIISLLKQRPEKAHWVIRFMSTGMMGGSWGEHVTIEMALGEGLVLSIFYAMEQTIPDPEIKKILGMSTGEEETHVQFGERETVEWLKDHPEDRHFLLGKVWIQYAALKRLRRFVVSRVIKGKEDHPVLKQFPEFYDQIISNYEKRIMRLGLSNVPLGELSFFTKLSFVWTIGLKNILGLFSRKPKLLTHKYLEDPIVVRELERPATGP